jgi:uncharacterized LabA/DUF88 family protein
MGAKSSQLFRTAHMIRTARERGLRVYVYSTKEEAPVMTQEALL